MAASFEMLKKLATLAEQYEELGRELSDPAVFEKQDRYRELSRTYSELGEVIAAFRQYQSLVQEQRDLAALIKAEADPELEALAREELRQAEEKLGQVVEQLGDLLTPKDPDADRNLFLEIRAGTGGDEAALFAGELYRMYQRFADRMAWKTELMSAHTTSGGGIKEVVLSVRGKGAYTALKHESGVHRVQRVPVTEASGRIHTSAVTVAVLPEAEEVDVEIKPDDLRVDVFRSSGPGGQSVNTTDSAVRVTHLPTGTVVSCQDEKSQHKNKAKAIRILRARLYDRLKREQEEKISAERRSQVGSGDRSAKIRTYNFPQSRVTDHRINLTLHRLSEILQGDLSELVEALAAHYKAEALKS